MATTIKTVFALGCRADIEGQDVTFYAPRGGGAWSKAGKASLDRGRVTRARGVAIPRDAALALVRKIEGGA